MVDGVDDGIDPVDLPLRAIDDLGARDLPGPDERKQGQPVKTSVFAA
jgi:hypothetical protein